MSCGDQRAPRVERPGRPKVPEEALVWVGCMGGCAFTDDGMERWLGGELVLQDDMFVHAVLEHG